MSERAQPSLPFLMLTAITCGAMVMVIEVLGSRVIGPFFGVSLYVWTSLITVAMVALAAGYGLGGKFADRFDTARTLYLIILLAGVTTALIPWLQYPVIDLGMHLGLRLGSLISATLLFGPPLFLLGCVSPYLIKIAAPQRERMGRIVGGFYSISTVGSVLGTVITGYYLIAYLEVDHIFQITAAFLISLSGLFFLLHERRLAPLYALVILPLIPTPGEAEITNRLPDGTEVKLLERSNSFYGHMMVLEYSGGGLANREMTINGLTQGGIDPNTGQSVYEYSYMLGMLPFALKSEIERALVIGLGTGAVPMWYEQRGVITDSVEIDPQVVNLARKHFGFQTRGITVENDARYFLNATDRRYDVVVADAFTGDATPHHLLSTEAIQLLKSRLTQGGVLAMNFIGDLGPGGRITASVIRTLEHSFDQVDIYPLFEVTETDRSGNIVFIAYDGPRRQPDSTRWDLSEVHPLARRHLGQYLTNRYDYRNRPQALLLRDQYNPADIFDHELRETHRRQIMQELMKLFS